MTKKDLRNPPKSEELAANLAAVKPTPHADPQRFGLAQHSRNVHFYHAPAGSEIDDYLRPEFWTIVGPKLRPLDRIEIQEECGQWLAELIVRSVGGDGVALVLRNYVSIGGAGAPGQKRALEDGSRVVYRGTFDGWCVFRNETLLIANLPSESAAERWLATHTEVVIKSSPGAAA